MGPIPHCARRREDCGRRARQRGALDGQHVVLRLTRVVVSHGAAANQAGRSAANRRHATKKRDLRFLSCFTTQNAIAQNRKQEFRTQNASVSKPSPLRIKITCRISKGRKEEAKTTKLAKTFTQN